MNPIYTNGIKITLAILFFLCLADMPYGFFQLVRFMALIGFLILAYNANNEGRKNEAIVYIGLALLFQPLIKISLGRTIWNIVDVIIGISLLLSIILNSTRKQKK